MIYSEFTERQYIKETAVKALLGISAGTMIMIIGGVMYKEYSEGNDIRELQFALLLVIVIELLVFLLIFRMPLDIAAGSGGMEISYRPYVRKKKEVSWQEITSWKIRKINAIGDFGGWGYRRSFRGKKTGYIMGSAKGIELQLQHGEVLVISSENVEMLARVCRKYAGEKEIKS
jgi:hypothetical protein